MKRMPFVRPADHYDERAAAIDEQICQLVRQRKDVTNNDPGYPPFHLIADWAHRYGLYEDLLKPLFGLLRNDEFYRPRVEPRGFRKVLPVLRFAVTDEAIYTVTYVYQYENASVVNLHVDLSARETAAEDQLPREEECRPHRHRHWELSVGEGYDCRHTGGGGAGDWMTQQYVIAPALPDDLVGNQFTFIEKETPLGEPTGVEVTIGID